MDWILLVHICIYFVIVSTFHKYYRVLIQGFESASIQSYLMLMRRRSVSYNVRVNTCLDLASIV